MQAGHRFLMKPLTRAECETYHLGEDKLGKRTSLTMQPGCGLVKLSAFAPGRCAAGVCTATAPTALRL